MQFLNVSFSPHLFHGDVPIELPSRMLLHLHRIVAHFRVHLTELRTGRLVFVTERLQFAEKFIGIPDLHPPISMEFISLRQTSCLTKGVSIRLGCDCIIGFIW
ncbi:hypothetical protein WR25_25070 [Diploscapter pachys]|uniref:Uncharacterized protein n=1 Tax=Diploscapter pachys TaxID=2018661 RepID=A0A2A2KRS0_9BILA|nr:hypothetical protein WR25_25070 [Diploscapter pachys]